jgi:hypothetical protein
VFGNREICANEQGLLRSRSIFQPEEMLDWFTASERASYMIGSVILADGGAVAS